MPGQTSLFEAPAVASSPRTPASDPNAFGCCSHYRACSDAGHCLISDQAYSASCSYRKNLEAGDVFYGPNSKGFSAARLSAFKRSVESLSADAQAAFDALLVAFCEYNRGCSRSVVRNQYIAELSALGLVDFRPLGADFPPRQESAWNYKKVLSLVENDPVYGPVYARSREAREAEAKSAPSKEKAGPRTKQFLLEWLNGEGVNMRDSISAPYCMASVASGAGSYLEELYRLRCLPSYDSRVYVLSPLAADGLLSDGAFDEEEERRVRLSHGYTVLFARQRFASQQFASEFDFFSHFPVPLTDLRPARWVRLSGPSAPGSR